MPEAEIDRIDLKILDLLQRNAGLSNLELADRVGLTPTPCARRVKRLEAAGIIVERITLLDQSKLGLALTAHIGITMDEHTPERLSLIHI